MQHDKSVKLNYIVAGKDYIEISKIMTEEKGYYFSREEVRKIIASARERSLL